MTLSAALLLAGSQAAAQTAASDPSAVVVRGTIRPKPAPEVAPPPLELFVTPPRIQQIALSPDGSRFAFVTAREGLRILTTYVTTDNSSQSVRLSDDSLSAITWLDNNHIMLSDTRSAIRGTCPSGIGQKLNESQALSDLISATTISGWGSGVASASDPMSTMDRILGMQLQNALSSPVCGSYGVRSHDAATVIDLRNSQSVTLGKRMSDYHNIALGLPKLITIDGKPMLVGAFLELRNRPIGGQVAQRVYLWRVDPDTGIGRMVDDRGGDIDRMGSYVDDWLVDAQGTPIARAAYTYLDTTAHIEIRENGKWKPVLKRKIDRKAHTFAPVLAGMGRDGQSLLILDAVDAPDGSRRFHYYELSADGKLSEALDTREATRDRPIFHPQTGALAGFEHQGEAATYTFFDPDLAEYYKLALEMAPDKAVRVAAMSQSADQMILFNQGGDDTGSWHYYDFASARRVDIGNQYPSVPAEWVASQRQISYKARDGMALRAILTLPPQGEATNRALVVLPHDGPLDHSSRGYNWLAQVLASRGYVVLQPNYRGSDGYDQTFTDAGYGEWSGRMLTDLADGVEYLAGKGIADPKRVCIAGQGYGGYAALASARKDLPYRCAVAINAITDPQDYVSRLKDRNKSDPIAALRADPQHTRNVLADSTSPSLIQRYYGAQAPAAISAASIDLPVLLVHNRFNKYTPAGRTRDLDADLRAAGKTGTYVELEDCGDGLGTEACRLTAARAIVDFLATNNPAK
ncbi:hypothetical protein ABAC460_00175 [Asticcacaulis sp. AC460]|uniref:alpha/beta hydrolase family protein n=1 Tax=Asticcacaulis sp. AC460 TaxID=1282360 RepID=UPI0003C3D8A5|nr:prolyl oligopeptidase family serine peptidase [Asticcacaulis sp. AC460]ESQ93517.1 hypothetical protein ABAC460_00175 [Asticcacaulis sp. AC460]